MLARLCFACFVMLSSSTIAFCQQPTEISDGFAVSKADWPWWRGPSRNGTASSEQEPPIDFGDPQAILWKSPVPFRGLGSPTVVGDRVFLVTCEESSGAQLALCFDRETGKQLWRSVVHSEGGMQQNSKSSAASCTPACDGQRIFVSFPNSGQLVVTALTLDGEQVWQQKIADYVVHQGYGASPALYQNLVIVSADNKGGGAVAALDRISGNVVWRRERPLAPNYSSPIIVRAAGQDQLIMTGCDQVVSYEPLTGETLWETEGATTECVTSTVTDGNLVLTSGGYPKNHVSAVKADGSGLLVWENSSRLYVPSLVIHDGFLYAVLDEGIAVCWNAADGRELWKSRLGGMFSSSLVLVGDRVYAVNENGEVFVFAARPDKFERLSKSQLGNQVFATPTIVGGRVYHRVANIDEGGERQEYLYCLGK